MQTKAYTRKADRIEAARFTPWGTDARGVAVATRTTRPSGELVFTTSDGARVQEKELLFPEEGELESFEYSAGTWWFFDAAGTRWRIEVGDFVQFDGDGKPVGPPIPPATLQRDFDEVGEVEP